MIEPRLLDGIEALAEVPAAARSALAEGLREADFKRDERLVGLLQAPTRIMFVIHGLAKMVGISATGVERIVYVYRPGDVMGSRVLLERGEDDSGYEVVAMTDPVKTLAITKADFLRISERHPEVLVAVTQAFTRRLEQQTGRMLAAMSSEVPVRLSQLLLDFTGTSAQGSDGMVPLAYPLTHEAMAQIIGASRPHTSTVLRDLEEHGAVRRKSPRGLLVKPAVLRSIAVRGTLRDEPV